MADIQPQVSTILASNSHTFEITQIEHFSQEDKVFFIRIHDLAISDQPICFGVGIYQGQLDHFVDTPISQLDEPACN